MPSGGSLTADQWLLLSTVYGPIIIPQLWSTCLPQDTDDDILCQCVSVIEKIEAQKQQEVTCKAMNKKALAEAKKQGKEAFDAERAQITQDNLTISETKKQEKLQQAAAKQVEEVRLTAAKKARNAEIKALKKHKATSQMVEDLPEGQVWLPPTPPGNILPAEGAPTDEGSAEVIEDNKFSLHPDNPINLLKLSTALGILIKQKLTDYNIALADLFL
ncbi:hypothetical protein BS17DRAFT_762812 [Gyrodon lividus]|nr:hypothetical protein BS17DRAFT_762812 [Gyrodon lividus]